MTTIATNGTAMAADGRLVQGDRVIKEDDDKMRTLFVERAGEHVLLGMAGCVAHMNLMQEFVEDCYLGKDTFLGTSFIPDESSYDPDVGHPGETVGLILLESGKVYLCGYGEPIIQVRKVMAIGSGSDLAIGAMMAGKTPGEAVLIASRVDLNTNGNVTERRLG